MAYLIVRGSEKQGGYVSMVEKGRVNGEVRTKAYICGLGSMTMSEFKAFQKWAHSLKPQEYRKQMVLASGRAITEKEEAPKRVKATTIQLKTTVKKPPKAQVTRTKRIVRKHYPVPPMAGYRGITHTRMMMERKKQTALEKEMRAMKYRKDHGIPEPTKPKTAQIPISKFSPEGIEFARQSKKALSRERLGRKQESYRR